MFFFSLLFFVFFAFSRSCQFGYFCKMYTGMLVFSVCFGSFGVW